jgi:hypothetical protein
MLQTYLNNKKIIKMERAFMSYDYSETRFIQQYGNMTVQEYVTRYHSTIKDMYDGCHETIESYTKKRSSLNSGRVWFILFQGMDDANYTLLYREVEHIEVMTRPNGESRSWLEIGTIKEYNHQNGQTYVKWIKDELKYPQHDRRIGDGRIFVGEYIYWRFNVALDYPLAIRLISRGPIIKNDILDTTERTLWKPR